MLQLAKRALSSELGTTTCLLELHRRMSSSVEELLARSAADLRNEPTASLVRLRGDILLRSQARDLQPADKTRLRQAAEGLREQLSVNFQVGPDLGF